VVPDLGGEFLPFVGRDVRQVGGDDIYGTRKRGKQVAVQAVNAAGDAMTAGIFCHDLQRAR
jgi:hypothetical protein